MKVGVCVGGRAVCVDVLVGGRVAVGVGLVNQPPTLEAMFFPMVDIFWGKITPRATRNTTASATQTHLLCSIFLWVGWGA